MAAKNMGDILRHEHQTKRLHLLISNDIMSDSTMRFKRQVTRHFYFLKSTNVAFLARLSP